MSIVLMTPMFGVAVWNDTRMRDFICSTRDVETFTAVDQWAALVHAEVVYKWRCEKSAAGKHLPCSAARRYHFTASE
jgi:hypothetical protein